HHSHRTLRATIADGRVVVGTLECVDALGNLVMGDALETTPKDPSSSGVGVARQRQMGLVMVPGKHLIKAEVREDYVL
ncbi:unnamed protein product, partial [Phaeothamnion confervicola]